MTNRPTFTILWQHDGAVSSRLSSTRTCRRSGRLEKRVRGIASIASSHRGLRMLLEPALADQWTVSVFDAVGGVTTVRLVLK